MAKADKRSVSTDALETLGTVIASNEKRDAIHLAVEPVEAAEILWPGQHIGLDSNGKATNTRTAKYLGIVDPFLKDRVAPGQWFWLIVYPRQITSLRHVWSHPDFAEADVVESYELSDSQQNDVLRQNENLLTQQRQLLAKIRSP